MRAALLNMLLIVFFSFAGAGPAWATNDIPQADYAFEVPHASSVVWDSVMVPDADEDYSRVRAASDLYGKPILFTGAEIQPEVITPVKSNDTATLWIIISLVVIAVAKYQFPLRFKETLMASWDGRYYSQIEREGGLLSNWVSFFLFLNFMLVLVLLVYHSLDAGTLMDAFSAVQPVLFFAYLLVAVMGFYLLKYILMVFLAWVFRTREATFSYFRNILIVNFFAGVALLPLLVIYTYQPTTILLYVAWGVLVAVNLYKVMRNLVIGVKATGFSAYYIILYLCAIELAPLLFIVKYAQNLLMA